MRSLRLKFNCGSGHPTIFLYPIPELSCSEYFNHMSQRAIHGNFVYFVTFNVEHRRWFFVTPKKAEKLGQAIRTSCEMKKFVLFGFCVLPNHVHLLVKPQGETMMGNAVASQRILEKMRCEEYIDLPNHKYLFPQRRHLPSCPRRARGGGSSRRGGRYEAHNLSNLMQSIKGSFSRTLPKGKFWQHRSNVRLVTDQEDFNNKINYIQYNYRKMNLDEKYRKIPWAYIDWKSIDAFFDKSIPS